MSPPEPRRVQAEGQEWGQGGVAHLQQLRALQDVDVLVRDRKAVLPGLGQLVLRPDSEALHLCRAGWGQHVAFGMATERTVQPPGSGDVRDPARARSRSRRPDPQWPGRSRSRSGWRSRWLGSRRRPAARPAPPGMSGVGADARACQRATTEMVQPCLIYLASHLFGGAPRSRGRSRGSRRSGRTRSRTGRSGRW